MAPDAVAGGRWRGKQRATRSASATAPVARIAARIMNQLLGGRCLIGSGGPYHTAQTHARQDFGAWLGLRASHLSIHVCGLWVISFSSDPRRSSVAEPRYPFNS